MAVEEAVFEAPDGRDVEARISIGIAEYDGDEDVAESMIARADLALYKAKEEGRNRVEIFDAGQDS